MEEILTFPPAPPSENPKNAVKLPPFHSGIWDILLKEEIANHTSPPFDGQVEQATALQDLTSVFSPRQADRPEIPLYVRNIIRERDVAVSGFKPPGKPHRDDIAHFTKIFTERRDRLDSIAVQRDNQKKSHAQQLAKQHADFLGTQFHSRSPIDIEVKQSWTTRQAARTQRLDDGKEAEQRTRDSPRKSPRS
jgi:hypothetical protein